MVDAIAEAPPQEQNLPRKIRVKEDPGAQKFREGQEQLQRQAARQEEEQAGVKAAEVRAKLQLVGKTPDHKVRLPHGPKVHANPGEVPFDPVTKEPDMKGTLIASEKQKPAA